MPLLLLRVHGTAPLHDLLYLQLLAKLLPALVQKLATAQPKTRAKVGHSRYTCMVCLIHAASDLLCMHAVFSCKE
jgi:hypothetical protein